MADGAYRLASFEELADELERRFVGAKLIGIEQAARYYESVVIVGLCVAQDPVNGDLIGGVEVLVAANRALFRRNDMDDGASVPQGFLRFCQFSRSKPCVARIATLRPSMD